MIDKEYTHFNNVLNHMGIGKLFEVWDYLYNKNYDILKRYGLVR